VNGKSSYRRVEEGGAVSMKEERTRGTEEERDSEKRNKVIASKGSGV
jgi:hypothetical protein